MFRKHLDRDAGMLFIFRHPQNLEFWGEHTYIPLDIAFIDKHGTIAKIAKIDSLDRRMVSSDVDCVMAVEVNRGFLHQHGIEAGHAVNLMKSKDGHILEIDKNAGNKPTLEEQSVKVAARRKWIFPNQLDLPFNNERQSNEVGAPQWMSDAFDARGQNPQDRAEDEDARQQAYDSYDDSNLPEINLADVMSADDDEYGEDDDAQHDVDEEQATDSIQPTDGQELPDVSQLTSSDAVDKAIKGGFVMWINYTTLPKKRSIGPLVMPKSITRIIQPHGKLTAKSTGNNLLVCWDLSISDFRSFVVDRIHDKGLTGQKFKRWFKVTQ